MAACRLPHCRIRYCDRYPYSRSIFRTPTTPFSPYLPPLLPTVFIAIFASVIWLIWNDPCIPSTPRRGKMESIETDSAFHFPSGEVLLCHFPASERLFLTQFPVSVCSCLHSLSFLARPYVRIIRYFCHRQHRRSSKECYATYSRRFGLPFGTSDRPLPTHWTASVAALPRNINPRSRSSCPQSSENPM